MCTMLYRINNKLRIIAEVWKGIYFIMISCFKRILLMLIASSIFMLGCTAPSKRTSSSDSSSKKASSVSEQTYEPVIPSTSKPSDNTDALDVTNEPAKFGTAQSATALTISGTNKDDVCDAIANYIKQYAPEYTGISTAYSSKNTNHQWLITDLSQYVSENVHYTNLERWSTEADDPYPNDPSKTYPYITAMIENTGTSFIVHRLSMGSTVFIDDDYIPEDSLSK